MDNRGKSRFTVAGHRQGQRGKLACLLFESAEERTKLRRFSYLAFRCLRAENRGCGRQRARIPAFGFLHHEDRGGNHNQRSRDSAVGILFGEVLSPPGDESAAAGHGIFGNDCGNDIQGSGGERVGQGCPTICALFVDGLFLYIHFQYDWFDNSISRRG